MIKYLLENIEFYKYDKFSKKLFLRKLNNYQKYIGKFYTVSEFEKLITDIESSLLQKGKKMISYLSPLYPDLKKNTITIDYTEANTTIFVNTDLPLNHELNKIKNIILKINNLTNKLIIDKGKLDKNIYENDYPFSIYTEIKDEQYKLKQYTDKNFENICLLYKKYTSTILDKLIIYLPKEKILELLDFFSNLSSIYDESPLNYILRAISLRKDISIHEKKYSEPLKKFIQYPSGYIRNKSLSIIDKKMLLDFSEDEVSFIKILSQGSQYNCSIPATNILRKINKG